MEEGRCRLIAAKAANLDSDDLSCVKFVYSCSRQDWRFPSLTPPGMGMESPVNLPGVYGYRKVTLCVRVYRRIAIGVYTARTSESKPAAKNR